MAIKIIMPGAYSTIQDSGRFGYEDSGIGTSGVMDMEAYKAANYLVGNQKDEAVIEMTFMGMTIEFLDDTIFSLTGGEMDGNLDNEVVSMNKAIFANKGETLTLSMVKSGCRTYIGFAGGIDVPVVMGSRSTNVKCNLGGLEGRALKANDEVKIGEIQDLRSYFDTIKDRQVEERTFPKEITLRVIEGPQIDMFTKRGIETLYNSTYEVSDQSDRMGYRLSGEPIETISGSDIVSDGISLGAIQVPANGKPIILLADRQTTGGYAKIAGVCSFDIPALAQATPGIKLHFKKISLEEAQKINESK
ncbi:MAG: biotin-dependent carboxyltransferase family protein [Lachnospiraceae bacterium]|jgi:biotin-dependent carboxylase-like uncharacterized protein|nr:biotin-dependent carboxyltransferase family protein [Lachnospiraceae bacterium]